VRLPGCATGLFTTAKRDRGTPPEMASPTHRTSKPPAPRTRSAYDGGTAFGQYR